MHSRVARSNLWALQALGAKVSFCAPDNMQAPDLDVRGLYYDGRSLASGCSHDASSTIGTT